MNKFKVLISAVTLTLVLTACGNSADSGDTIRYAAQSNPVSADMRKVTDAGSLEIINTAFEGLLDYNGEEIIPAGAESYTVSDDNLTYTFKLREDAKWVDYEGNVVGDVTADDYVYSWKMMVDPEEGTDYGYIFGGIIANATEILNKEKSVDELGIKAIDDYTLEVTAAFNRAYILEVLTFPALKPFSKEAIEKFGDKYGSGAEYLYSNGSYTLTDWKTDSKLLYDKNQEYWDADNVKFEHIENPIIDDTSAMFNAYKNDELDIASVNTADILKEVENSDEYSKEFVKTPYSQVGNLVMNTQNEKMQNKNLRLAILNSFDSDEYVNGISVGLDRVPQGIVAEGVTVGGYGEDYREKVGPVFEPNNDELAKEYAQKAKEELGVDELSFKFTIFDAETNKILAEFLQEELKENGIEMEIELVPSDVFWNTLKSGEFEMGLTYWIADYGDPGNYLTSLFHSKQYTLTNYATKDPELDKLLDAAEAEVDTDARFNKFLEAEQYVIDNAYVLPLMQVDRKRVIKPGLVIPDHPFIKIVPKYYTVEE